METKPVSVSDNFIDHEIKLRIHDYRFKIIESKLNWIISLLVGGMVLPFFFTFYGVGLNEMSRIIFDWYVHTKNLIKVAIENIEEGIFLEESKFAIDEYNRKLLVIEENHPEIKKQYDAMHKLGFAKEQLKRILCGEG